MYKNIVHGKKAVFFDLDGTIINSAEYWQTAFNNVARSLNIPTISSYVIHFGSSLGNALRRSLDGAITKPEKSFEEILSMINDEYLRIFAENPLEPRDGFWDLVYELKEEKKLKLALVSNSIKRVVLGVFESMGVDLVLFDLVITGDEVKKRKPNPEIYNTAAKKLGVHKKDVLVFEDSVTGMTSAVKAGMDVIVIWTGVVRADLYSNKYRLLLPDFLGLAGKLDTTYREFLEKRLNDYNKENSPQEAAPTLN